MEQRGILPERHAQPIRHCVLLLADVRLQIIGVPPGEPPPPPPDVQPQTIGAELARLRELPQPVDAQPQIIFAGPLQLQVELPSPVMRLVWLRGQRYKQQLSRAELLQLVVPHRITGVELPRFRVQLTRHFAPAELLRLAMRPVLLLRLLLHKLLLVRLIRRPAPVVLSTPLMLGHMTQTVICCRATRW